MILIDEGKRQQSGNMGAIRTLKTPSMQCSAMNSPSFNTGEFYLLLGIHEVQ
jgi:hypothetical protein